MGNPKFVTIAEARLNPKGTSLIIKVVSVGEMKQGTAGNGEPYKRQQVVIKDNSDIQELTVWNKEIGMLEVGKCYKLGTPYWKEYEGTLQLGLGKYCVVMECQESDLLPTTTNQTTSSVTQSTTQSTQTAGSVQTTQSSGNESKGIDFRKLINEKALETAKKQAGAQLPLITERLDTIWAVELLTRNYLLTTENQEPNAMRVGMYVKLVLDKVEKV